MRFHVTNLNCPELQFSQKLMKFGLSWLFLFIKKGTYVSPMHTTRRVERDIPWFTDQWVTSALYNFPNWPVHSKHSIIVYDSIDFDRK